MARALPLLGMLVAQAAACSSYQPAGTQTTSAQKYAAGSPELRTVDNAGYVDPAGRTRQVSAGGGAAPVGTGNPVPPAHREEPSRSRSGTERASESAQPTLPATATDPSDFNERAARALCDRETYCDRIGRGKTFESADACMVDKRDRVHRAIREMSCTQIRGDRIAACLTAIRGAPCGSGGAPVQPPAACTADPLCEP